MGGFGNYRNFGRANFGNNKYGNVKIECDGLKFDSKREMKHYQELKWQEKAGLIRDLKLQVPFLLQEAFKYNGETIRKIEHIVDFTFYDVKRNKKVAWESKGFEEEKWKLKRKLFLYKYGHEYIYEVHK